MKKDTVYISHMLDAIERINEYVSGLDLSDFIENHLIQAAVIRELEIIGEASKHISEETRSSTDKIPWRRVAGMRDKLIHDYMGVDLESVWDTIIRDIPYLESNLLEIFENIK